MGNQLLIFILLFCLLVLTGCSTSYYRIVDPVTDKVYYTTDFDEEGGGAVTFKDAVSRRQVTLQQFEVMEIHRDQFEAAGKTREVEN